jgi:hypothetical protein
LVGEPERVAGVSDQCGGDNVADAEDVGQSRSRCSDRSADTSRGCLALVVEPLDVVDELEGETVSFDGGRARRFDPVEHP